MARVVWDREHLMSYLAGGLSTEERYELQEHLKTDPDLAAELESLRGFDDRLRKLFAATRPSPTLEDTVVRALREKSTTVRRAAAWSPFVRGSLMAACVLMVVGLSLAVLSTNELRMSSFGHLVPASMEVALVDDSRSVGGDPESREFDYSYLLHGTTHHGPNAGKDIDRVATSYFDNNVSGVVTGLMPAGQLTPESISPPSAYYQTDPKLRQNLSSRLAASPGGTRESNVIYPNMPTLGLIVGEGRTATTMTGGITGNKTAKKPAAGWAEAKEEKKTEAPSKVGKVYIVGDEVKDSRDFMRSTGIGPKENLRYPKDGSGKKNESAVPSEPSVLPVAPPAPPESSVYPSSPAPVTASPVPTAPASSPPSPLADSPGNQPQQPATESGIANAGQDRDKKFSDERKEILKLQTQELESMIPKLDRELSSQSLVDRFKNIQFERDGKVVQPDEGSEKAIRTSAQHNPKTDPDAKQPEQKPLAQKRIVIRTGDIEFEVESFDAAVGIITKLIAKTKAGIVATTNSAQLANGKMKGTVVVRMPPEELDDFVAALRRDLGKAGELKRQDIRSQDVTKQYTDMESELRGLRVSETRLIEMLKDSKAKLSDLLAVENQLAKTRTRIETIEGELRYYSNQAAMSTLTIELTEKQIRTAAEIVESERVQAGIESEDVEKAFQDLKAAIIEAKGRVIQSELKQTAIGRLQATLQFEVSPDSAGTMRDRMRQIGVVSRLDIDRMTAVESNGLATRESKIKRGDTQFLVNIFDLSSYDPRETVNTRIVANDVPVSYRSLRDLIAKVNGKLLKSSLQNTDARNVIAELSFTVKRADEPAIQTAIAAAGEILTRRVDRAPESGRNLTDSKVRFDIRLDSVTSITARESNNVTLAALDVPTSYRDLRDAILKIKGSIRDAKLLENDRNNITATLDFDVARTDEAAITAALLKAGEITARQITRRPESELVTDAKINYHVSLISVAALTPRETVELKIAVTDVPATFASLREAAGKSEALVQTANLNENDRRDINARLDFTVLRVKDDAIVAALAAAGEQINRQVDRQSGGPQLTDAKVAYRVQIVSTNAIEPREINEFKIRVENVEERLRFFQARVREVNGRILTGPEIEKQSNGKTIIYLKFDIPLASANAFVDDLNKSGYVAVRKEFKNPKAPEGRLATARFDVFLFDADLLLPQDESFFTQLRNWISLSLRGLSIAASVVIAILLFLAPWALVAWIVAAVLRRRNRPTASEPAKT